MDHKMTWQHCFWLKQPRNFSIPQLTSVTLVNNSSVGCHWKTISNHIVVSLIYPIFLCSIGISIIGIIDLPYIQLYWTNIYKVDQRYQPCLTVVTDSYSMAADRTVVYQCDKCSIGISIIGHQISQAYELMENLMMFLYY